MLSLSERLAKDIPFLRTDFYIVDHKIYFSELTFFPASGLDRFVPEEWDGILGSWLVLPNSDRSLNTWEEVERSEVLSQARNDIPLPKER